MFLSLYALLLCNDALFIVWNIKCWFAQLAAGATATLEQATLTSSVWSRVNKRTSCQQGRHQNGRRRFIWGLQEVNVWRNPDAPKGREHNHK